VIFTVATQNNGDSRKSRHRTKITVKATVTVKVTDKDVMIDVIKNRASKDARKVE